MSGHCIGDERGTGGDNLGMGGAIGSLEILIGTTMLK
jgi:hypothetical protein